VGGPDAGGGELAVADVEEDELLVQDRSTTSAAARSTFTRISSDVAGQE